MGLYLRKSLSFGPFRLNLSQYGLGLSTGVKGLRFGVRPNGQTYVHMGRYGIYYRKNLGHLANCQPQSQSPNDPPPHPQDLDDSAGEIHSASVVSQ
jgi:hypothetical protein